VVADQDSATTAKRGRGRPPKSQQALEARRREAVEAAYELFAEKGYHATAMSDIARALDIAQGTLYLSFKNKREVLDHVVDHVFEQVFTPVASGLGEAATTADEFRAQVRTLGQSLFEDVLDRDPRLLRMILLDLSAVDDELLARAVGVVASIEAVLAGYLGHAADHGFLVVGLEPAAAAKVVIGSCMAAVVSSVRSPMTGKEREAYVGAVVLMLCGPVA
jgi:AcrR family transcriptional regulator